MAGEKQSFGVQAARFSLYAPVTAIVIGFLTRGQFEHDDQDARLGLIIGVLNCSLIVAGFVLGIVALSLARRHPSERIVGTAIAGLVFNAILIAAVLSFLVPPFMASRVKEKVVGHWQAQSKPSLAQSDFTFNKDGTYRFKAVNPDGGHVAVEGRWAFTLAKKINLTVEHVTDGDRSAAGKTMTLGTVKSADDSQMTVGTDLGDVLYKRIP